MTGKPVEPDPSATGEAIAVAATVILLSNGVLSALTGSWIRTAVALVVIVRAGWFGRLPGRNRN